MNTIKINHKNVSMIAHRGVSGIEMENTCAAFVAAGNRSYFGIETDVHVTKDNHIAVIHDDTLKRVAGVDLIVEETTLAELQSIPLYNKIVDSFRTDLKIPILADYISICKRYEKKAILELKNRIDLEDIAKIVGIIKEMEYLENVIFISFRWENLADLRKLLPEQPVQFLTTKYDDALIEDLIKNRFDLPVTLRIHFKTSLCYTISKKSQRNTFLIKIITGFSRQFFNNLHEVFLPYFFGRSF